MIHIKGNLMSLKSNQHILYLDSIKRYCKNLKSFIDCYEIHKEEFDKFIELLNQLTLMSIPSLKELNE